MHLDAVVIRNFRGLKEIEFEAPSPLTVIVGPNAVGKTSILEAIRLAKAGLMEGYDAEAMQVLQSLGALSPNIGRLTIETLLGDKTKQMLIRLRMSLSPAEIEELASSSERIAISILRATMGIQGDDTTIMRVLSSPGIRERLGETKLEVTTRLDAIRKNPTIQITLLADPTSGVIRGEDLLLQSFVTFLARTTTPSQGVFNYFPADRAMPTGEVGIQLGTHDMQLQMQSHVGTPNIKYQRLKNHVVTQFLMGEASRKRLFDDFELVFSELLHDKKLKGISVTPNGLVSILVEEPARKAEYDMDAMSSGEKGLALTFLLLRQSCAPGSVVLLDEPELHLNPTVTRRVVPFLMKHVLSTTPSQALVCTHAHEIIADAYNRDDCTLLHLRSSTVISHVRREDKAEIQEALRRLGVDTADVLSVRGTLFVEGKSDLELLEIGFPERLAGYRVVPLGGRTEIEKEIRALQAREAQIESPQCFVFDLDNRPTSITNSAMVRVGQWDRYCFENYLLEEECIYDVLSSIPAAKRPSSVGEVRPMLKRLAMSQLPGEIARRVYGEYTFENPGLRPSALASNDFETISQSIWTTLARVQESVGALQETDWRADFVQRCLQAKAEMENDWDSNWKKRSDGKRLLQDLHKEVEAKISVSEFRKRLVREIMRARAPSWREVDSILSEVIPQRP